MSGLFATFNVAKRGLFAQQKAIDVTTHNIANANTEGYSRQRAMMETTTPFSMPSVNNAIGPGQLGTGVQISIIQRVRDEFLDYQFRNESSTMGMYEARDRFLSEIESVFNEPSDKGLSTVIGKFFDSWQELSKQAETSNARTVVAQQANALANELNHTYNQLQKIRSNTQMVIKDTVFQVNNYLDQIDSLNQQIMNVKISGQEPNDLMDKRDLLVDKLSSEFNIDIKKKNFYTVDLNPTDVETIPEGGEKLLVRKEPNYAVSRFSYINGIEEIKNDEGKITALKVSYLKEGDSNKPGKEILINFNTPIEQGKAKEIKRHIDECRVMWAEEDGTAYANKSIEITNVNDLSLLDKKLGLFNPSSGSLQGYMSVQRDVDNYEDQINKLAKAVAFSVNIVHSGESDAAKDNMPFFVNKDKFKLNPDGTIESLGEDEIDASNIGVNSAILDNVMNIKAGAGDNPGENDGKRALAIAKLRNTLFKIQNINLSQIDRERFIEDLTGGLVENKDLGVYTLESNLNGMTIDNYFKDTVDTLGIQENEARRIIGNQEKLLSNFEERRTSISGVSMDEEMANLIQFQHAYGANAKIISTVDELLDVVVNGLKR